MWPAVGMEETTMSAAVVGEVNREQYIQAKKKELSWP